MYQGVEVTVPLHLEPRLRMLGISPRVSHTSLCDTVDVTLLGKWKIDDDLTVFFYVRV